MIIVGKAVTNANSHAFNQTVTISATNPRLNIEIMNDIIPDISKAIKNEKT